MHKTAKIMYAGSPCVVALLTCSMYIMLACGIKGAGQQAPVMFSVPHANGGNVDVIC